MIVSSCGNICMMMIVMSLMWCLVKCMCEKVYVV